MRCGEKRGTRAGFQRHYYAGETPCKECRAADREYKRQRRAANIEEFRERERSYRAANLERRQEYERKYRAENAEAQAEQAKRWARKMAKRLPVSAHGPYNPAEDAVLRRTDISAIEMAALTGRSYQSVVGRRHRLRQQGLL